MNISPWVHWAGTSPVAQAALRVHAALGLKCVSNLCAPSRQGHSVHRPAADRASHSRTAVSGLEAVHIIQL
jgi:hypothetical protein